MSLGTNAIGMPRLPIGVAFVSSVLNLVVAGATQLQAKHIVTRNMREDRISQRLNEEMEVLHRGSDSDIVNWNMRPARTIPEKPDEVFEVDFSFHADILPRDQRCYLAVEAKRLRGKGDSLASDYVQEGVLRFVTGKYSRGHDYAVMLGYVVLAPIDRAVTSVKTAMDRSVDKTCEQSAFTSNSQICTHSHTYASVHQQHGVQDRFTLVHLFVDLC